MSSSNTRIKEAQGAVLKRIPGDIGRATRAEMFAVKALTEALARKKKAEARLAELGRSPLVSMKDLIKQVS